MRPERGLYTGLLARKSVSIDETDKNAHAIIY
jgi:hypothetical protein